MAKKKAKKNNFDLTPYEIDKAREDLQTALTSLQSATRNSMKRGKDVNLLFTSIQLIDVIRQAIEAWAVSQGLQGGK